MRQRFLRKKCYHLSRNAIMKCYQLAFLREEMLSATRVGDSVSSLRNCEPDSGYKEAESNAGQHNTTQHSTTQHNTTQRPRVTRHTLCGVTVARHGPSPPPPWLGKLLGSFRWSSHPSAAKETWANYPIRACTILAISTSRAINDFLLQKIRGQGDKVRS